MNSFYNDTLYPIQDKVLEIIQKSDSPFYLTGGTALSRFYFNHRYSDDLDFFVNQDTNFVLDADQITATLGKSAVVEIKLKSTTYYSIVVNELLKVDLVNDVGFRYGEAKSFPEFNRVDNVENILSNKLSALISRDEPKDVVDIWIIAKNISVDWPKMFQDANSKAAGIFPPEVAKKLTEFPTTMLEKIKWINDQPEAQVFSADITNICNSILKEEID